ncbi:MAG: ABC transporter substrate-binding protein [Pseudomonadota bacterium]
MTHRSRSYPSTPLLDRRAILAGVAGLALAVAAPGPAQALSPDEARSFVRETIDEVVALTTGPGSPDQKAQKFLAILERRAALPQIARFAAGPTWRDMSKAQQDDYVAAFKTYLANIYAARFQEYSGQKVDLGGVDDLGKRGVEVASTVSGGGTAPIAVSWVVSDRPGRTVIADIKIEGVSLLITQREEVAGILSKEGGIDGMIAFLRSV